MKKKDLVSVVIPCHNEEGMIGKCIESLHKQTYKPIEIIVVDDGSTDSSVKIAESYGVKVISLPEHRGEATSRSTGALAAKGEYIAEIDADAVYPETWVEEMYDSTKEANAIGSAYGYINVYYDKETLLTRFWKYKRKATYLLRSEGKREVKGLWFFKRELIDKIGAYDEHIVCGCDVDFSKRAEKAGYKIAWAKDTYITHKDPSDFFVMMKRLWWGAVNCKRFEEKWGDSFKPKNLALLFLRNLVATTIPIFLFLSLSSPIWLIVAAAVFAAEAVSPMTLPDWRLIAWLALKEKDLAFLLTYPFILWSIARVTGYGKMYAFFFK